MHFRSPESKGIRRLVATVDNETIFSAKLATIKNYHMFRYQSDVECRVHVMGSPILLPDTRLGWGYQ